MSYANLFENSLFTCSRSDTKGAATATDRIIILSDINPFEKFSHQTTVETLDFNFVQSMTDFFLGSSNDN